MGLPFPDPYQESYPPGVLEITPHAAVATVHSDVPTMSNTKAEIINWLVGHGTAEGGLDHMTKTELLDLVGEPDQGRNQMTQETQSEPDPVDPTHEPVPAPEPEPEPEPHGPEPDEEPNGDEGE